MNSPYSDPILDLLADGNERTVEEIRKGIDAPQNARIHHVLSELKVFIAGSKAQRRLKCRRVCGRLYYRYEISAFGISSAERN